METFSTVLPPIGLLRLHQIIGNSKAEPPIPPLIPVSKSTWYAGIKAGRFPEPVKMLGGRIAVWRAQDTRAEKVPDEPHSAPLAGLVVSTDAGEIDVRRMLARINERIEALFDRDHCIGHAYFTHLWRTEDGAQRFEALADTFRNRVLPLLEEYFFEDWRKIRLVLGDKQKPDAAQFITESAAHEQTLNELFGDDHGLDSYTTPRRHQLQPSAFDHPAAYLGIYQPVA